MALRFENKEYVLEKELKELDENEATPEDLAAYKKHYDDATKVACIMVATMSPELQRALEEILPTISARYQGWQSEAIFGRV
ncbi:unnamed protein product [Lactuca virosa]|uniref:Uncharacterized protein n=1 Tax=Lactuca virosa TaxID=75947 RepID=A0AAU9LP05_9ASTR|nr:unnamed protein product [Lactuca virosa]CAH1416142.1 unnamed protein product [Lactuca virosa]CAH1417100.1 unnamed protein product [Lactuca virosa]CAH1425635.1 unnamed protein product [Lactuca virosa]CAH1430577.1 unnamed protein product [Lactuca virosa]